MNTVTLSDAELWTAINGLRHAADVLREDAGKAGSLGAALLEAADAYTALAVKLEESQS